MSLHNILIDSGEAAWVSKQGANVVCTADADCKVGTKSAKMAVSAGLGAALLATQDIVAEATDYSDCRKVRLWIKSSIDTDAGDLQLLLDATADCPTPEETLDIPALTAGTWTLVDIALANPASDGAIVSVGLKQTKELGALDVYIDDCNGCEVYPEYQKRGMLGWYAGGGKWVPFKVDANGEMSIVCTVADIVTAHISHWGGTPLTGRDISAKGLGFSGAIYENEDTATDNDARRFETSEKKLRDVIIQVITNDQDFGDASNQRYTVAAGDTIGFTQVDLSTLYFRNTTPGQNGTVKILGVED